MAKGITIRATSGELVFDAFLQDAAGNLVTSGNTYFRLYKRVESDGTLLSFDFNDAAFKSGALTTENLSAAHRKGNNNTRDTGIWTNRVSSLNNFVPGSILYAQVDSTYASPKIQTVKFQWGSAEGDMDVNASGYLNSNVNSWRDSIPDIIQSGMIHAYTNNTGGGGGGGDVNVISWGGTSVTAMVSGLIPVIVSDYDANKWPLQPQVARRNIDVTTSGTVGINWGNIENQSRYANLINTAISGMNTPVSVSVSSVNVSGWLGLPPNALVNGKIDSYVSLIKDNLITSGTLDSTAITKIQTGLSTNQDILSVSGKLNNLSVNVSGWLGLTPNILNSGRVESYVTAINANVVNAVAISQDAITEIQTGLPLLSDLLSVSGKLNNLSVNVSGWRGLLPNILNNGRLDSYVGAMATDVLDSNALATTAVTEIQTGLPLLSDLLSVSGKLNNLSVNISGWRGLLPNILQNGRVDSYVGAMATDTLDANALAASAVTEIQTGLVTNSDILSVSGKLNNLSVNISGWKGLVPNTLISGNVPVNVQAYAIGEIPLKGIVQTRPVDVTASGTIGINWGNIENPSANNRLVNTSISGVDYLSVNLSSNVNITGWLGLKPNVLQNGRVDSYVGAMGTDTLNAAALATDAVTEINAGYPTSSDLMSVSGRFNNLSTNVSGWLGLTPNILVQGKVDSFTSLIKDNLITSGTLDSTAITKIQTGLSTNNDVMSLSGRFNLISANVSGWLGLVPNVLVNGKIDSYVSLIKDNLITSGTLDTTSINKIQAGLATNSDVLSISGKFNNLSVNISGWRGLQPNNLISGLVDVYPASSTSFAGTVSANVIQWLGSGVSPLISGNLPSIVNAYASGELPLKGIVQNRPVDVTSSGTVGINWGNIENKSSLVRLLNTSISGVDYLTSVGGSSNVNITGWLGLPPNSLISGRVDAYIGMMGTDVLTSNALATNAVNEIQTGLSTNQDLLSISGKFSNISTNISGWMGISPNALVNGKVDSYTSLIKDNLITSGTLDATAISKIQNGLVTNSDILSVSGKLNNLSVNISGWLGVTPNILVNGKVDSYTSLIKDNLITSGTLDTTAITKIQAGLSTNSDILSVSGKINNLSVNVSGWRGLQPNILNNGRVDSYVGAMGTDVLNAAALATDAVTEINTGMPTLQDLLSVSGRLNNLSVNISGWNGLAPNILVNGKVDSYTSLIKDNLITSGTLDSTAITKIQTGLATNQDILSISGKFTNLSVNISGWRGLQPNTLINNRVDSFVGAMGVDVVNSGAISSDAVTEIQNGLATKSDIISISGLIGGTGIVNSNVIMWNGVSVNPLISGWLQSIPMGYIEITQPLQPSVYGRKLDVSTSGFTGIYANLDKFNYNLSSSGLDFVSTVAPTGVAGNYREMNVQLWRRFFKKVTLDASSGIITYADNGTTMITRQPVSDNGTTQTQSSS